VQVGFSAPGWAGQKAVTGYVGVFGDLFQLPGNCFEMIIYTDCINQDPRKLFFSGRKNHRKPKKPFSLSIAAIPAESNSFIGVAVLIADTGYELYAA
jgi:hypothetical protein